MTDTTAAIPVPATFGDYEYGHKARTGRVDGVVVPVDVEYDPAAPEIGILTGEWRAYVTPSDARLVDRAEWDAAHPGVEPTADAIRAVVAAARLKIEQDAEDQAADAADDDFDAPESEDY